jgi:biopolymer transport protein ExbD
MDIRGRNKVNPNFNMSSMTDIVFLLLIFFMITSTLVTVNAIDVILPKAGGKTENKTSVYVSVNADGKFYIGTEEIAGDQLEQAILNELGENKDKVVVIRGDEQTDYQNIMKVIDISNRNKLKMILAVQGM